MAVQTSSSEERCDVVAPKAWRRQVPWATVATASVIAGVVIAQHFAKLVGDGPGRTSYDTTESRVGWVVAATGCCLLLLVAFGFPQWVKHLGMVLIAMILAAAWWYVIQDPHVLVATRKDPDPVDASCGSTALHNGFDREGPWELRTEAQRDCQARGRLTVGTSSLAVVLGVVGVAVAFRRETEITPRGT